ncbi:MAG TPA: hypothetical protein VGM66_10775 [Candidatus Udaeobacter sp.]|jgi:regulator of replication initiation timing
MKIADLFLPIERLIEEHGSAAVQSKHIAFLREQLSVLKEQFALLQAENERLKAENTELKTRNDDLRQQIEKLKQPPATPRWGSNPRIKGRMEP